MSRALQVYPPAHIRTQYRLYCYMPEIDQLITWDFADLTEAYDLVNSFIEQVGLRDIYTITVMMEAVV